MKIVNVDRFFAMFDDCCTHDQYTLVLKLMVNDVDEYNCAKYSKACKQADVPHNVGKRLRAKLLAHNYALQVDDGVIMFDPKILIHSEDKLPQIEQLWFNLKTITNDTD